MELTIDFTWSPAHAPERVQSEATRAAPAALWDIFSIMIANVGPLGYFRQHIRFDLRGNRAKNAMLQSTSLIFCLK